MSMQRSSVLSEVLEATVKSVAEQIAKRPNAVNNIRLTENTVFHELAACILGSRVTFEQALAASNRLQRVQVIQAVRFRTRRASLIRAVQTALRGCGAGCIGY